MIKSQPITLQNTSTSPIPPAETGIDFDNGLLVILSGAAVPLSGFGFALKERQMYRRVMAFDFDGTLAENGQVPADLRAALVQLRDKGFALFLVTGRQYETVPVEEWHQVFRGIVWENGAALTVRDLNEMYLPFGHIDARLVASLEAEGVPLEYGIAIVATQTAHEDRVWRVLSETGYDAVLVHNKGALMLLPPGTSKGTGLARLLELCGYSARNLVSFGDGENDLALFQISETGIAVADAVPSLRAAASYVCTKPGPAGTLEALQTFWLNGRSLEEIPHVQHLIPLGKDENSAPVHLDGAYLIHNNLGIFGDSGSGKSWVTGLLVEGMHLAGYQVLLIDPEGDFRGMHSLPGIVSLSGNEVAMPSPALITALLAEASISVVLDLCHFPIDRRGDYVTDLFKSLRPLREHHFRPHWLVLEEAQHFLPPNPSALTEAIAPLLMDGGWAFVSFRPDRLATAVIEAIDNCLVASLSEPEAARVVCQINSLVNDTSLEQLPRGQMLMCGAKLVQLRPSARRVPHIRHLYKYLDIPLPKHKRFHFHTPEKNLGLEVANLFEFREILPHLPIESLSYHLRRGDFAAWVKGALDDEVLANHLDKLAHRPELTGEALRQALLDRVSDRYVELRSLR